MTLKTGMSTMRLRHLASGERIRSERAFSESEADGHSAASVAGGSDRIRTWKAKMVGNFLMRRRAAMLAAMTFDEIGQGLLYDHERLHTVWRYAVPVCDRVNEFCGRLKWTAGLSLAKSLA